MDNESLAYWSTVSKDSSSISILLLHKFYKRFCFLCKQIFVYKTRTRKLDILFRARIIGIVPRVAGVLHFIVCAWIFHTLNATLNKR